MISLLVNHKIRCNDVNELDFFQNDTKWIAERVSTQLADLSFMGVKNEKKDTMYVSPDLNLRVLSYLPTVENPNF